MSWFNRAISRVVDVLRPRASNPVRLESLRKSGTMSTLTSTAIFFTMSAAEKIFSDAEFQCPCNLDAMVHQTIKTKVEHVDYGHFIWTYRFVYGFACIFVPAIALFFLAIVLNPTTWILSTGFCHTRLACHWRSQLLLWRVLGKAVVVALAWIFFALLNGAYIKCAMTVESCNTGQSSRGVTALNPDVWVAMSRLLALLVGLSATILSCCGNVLVRCCFKTNSYHEECLKAKYKERKMQRLEDIEKATVDRMVELQLKREGYTELESLESGGIVVQQGLVQQGQRDLCDEKRSRDVENIPSIDGVDSSTEQASHAAAMEAESLDKMIENLQTDLRHITTKIEDYNFSQNRLEKELGFGKGGRDGKKGKEENESNSKARKTNKEETVETRKLMSSMPLLGPGMSLSPGIVDETDSRYPQYARQTTNATENDYYTRQSTVLTNDTLLTESMVDGPNKQKVDEKCIKIDL